MSWINSKIIGSGLLSRDTSSLIAGGGLVGFWPLDETSGTRKNVSSAGSALDLTDVNTVGFASGVASNAALFVNASNEYLELVSAAPLVFTGSFSLSLWVYMTSKSHNSVLMSKGDSSALDNIGYQVVYRTSEDRFAFFLSDGINLPAGLFANNLGIPSLNTWYYLTCWYDSVGLTHSIQVDNGIADTAPFTAALGIPTDPFRIGRAKSIGSAADARIDEAGAWSRVLTSAEKLTLGAPKAFPWR